MYGLLLAIAVSIPLSKMDAWASSVGYMPIPAWIFSLAMLMGVYLLKGAGNINRSLSVVSKNKVIFGVLLLVSLMYLVSIWTDQNAGEMGLYFLNLFNVFYLFLLVGLGQDIVKYRRIVFGMALILIEGSLFVDVMSPGTFSESFYRAAGFAVNPNGAALNMLFSLVCFMDFKRLMKSDVILVVVSLPLMMYTSSRTGLLLLVLLLLVILTVLVRQKVVSKLSIIVSSFFVVLVAQYFFANYFFNTALFDSEFVLQRINPFAQSEVIARDNSRIEVLVEYMGIIVNNPLLGVGPGFNANRAETGLLAHNTIVNLMAEIGVLALPLIIFLMVSFFVKAWHSRLVFAWIFVMMILSYLFINNFLFSNRSFLVLLAVFVSVVDMHMQVKFNNDKKNGLRSI